jgi:DNA-binding protein H-NS
MHLHQQLDRVRETYTHITERIGSPQTLVVTKTRPWESEVKAWKARQAEARVEFQAYRLQNLRELLGDDFENITGLSSAESRGGRAPKRQKVGAAHSENHNHILSSSLHAQNVGDASTAAGAGTKRKLGETIDLTQD